MNEFHSGYLLLGLCVICSSLSQIFQKCAADSHGASSSFVASLLNKYTFLSFLSLGISLVLWLAALASLELHIAYASLSLSAVVVLIASRVHFRETVPRKRWIGMLLIISGTFLVIYGAAD